MQKIGTAIERVSEVLQTSPLECGRNLPARPGPAGPPRLLDREADYTIPGRVWSTWIPADGARAIVRELKADERGVLVRRKTELGDALDRYSAADEDRVIAAISAMFGGYRSMRQQDSDAIAILDGTRRVLAEFPAWAIERGCLKIQQGAASLDRRFAPNDAEIYSVVLEIVKPYRDALRTVAGVLAAPIEPPPPPRLPPQHDWHVWKWRCQVSVGDGLHGARVSADLAAREVRRQSAGAICGND